MIAFLLRAYPLFGNLTEWDCTNEDHCPVICFRVGRMHWQPAERRNEANCRRPMHSAHGRCVRRYGDGGHDDLAHHGPRCATCGERDYAEPACRRVWTLNDVSLAPTRKVYRLIRAISPSGVLASTFSRVSSRCRLAWKSESVVMLRAAASCSESKPKHQSSLLSFSEAVKRGAFDAVDCVWSAM